MGTVVIVIDMVRGFLEEGHPLYCGERARSIIPKRRYSCFWDTVLGERLAELQADELVVAGVCTDICVMHTVADARNRGYVVQVPQNCVASFDPEAHALKHMEKVLGAQIV